MKRSATKPPSESALRQLAARNKRLEELSALKDEFVAKVSHELRSPLTAIKEGISLVLDEALGAINAEQRDFLRTVDENIDRLTELINNMLDLSKIEAGRLPLIRRRLALGPLIATTLSSYKALAGPRQLKLDLVPVPDVFADPHRVLQVLGNLLSNAVKFTDEGGRITMSLREEEGDVAVSVQDTGIGIAPDELPRLFQKFSQVGPADKRAQGSGLGLVLCKELVELHQGRMRVASDLGKGSIFTVTLPRYASQSALRESVQELVELAKTSEEGTVGVIALDSDPLLPFLKDALAPTPLLGVAELVRQLLHRGDIILDVEPRWVVILVLADAQGVRAIVARLRQALQERLALSPDAAANLMQFGAAMHPADGSDAQALFRNATQALNCGVTAQPRRTE